LYDSLGVISVVKSRRTRWADYVVRMGDMRKEYNTSVEKTLKGRDHLQDLGIDRNIAL